jgi:hypothetical protein
MDGTTSTSARLPANPLCPDFRLRHRGRTDQQRSGRVRAATARVPGRSGCHDVGPGPAVPVPVEALAGSDLQRPGPGRASAAVLSEFDRYVRPVRLDQHLRQPVEHDGAGCDPVPSGFRAQRPAAQRGPAHRQPVVGGPAQLLQPLDAGRLQSGGRRHGLLPADARAGDREHIADGHAGAPVRPSQPAGQAGQNENPLQAAEHPARRPTNRFWRGDGALHPCELVRGRGRFDTTAATSSTRSSRTRATAPLRPRSRPPSRSGRSSAAPRNGSCGTRT